MLFSLDSAAILHFTHSEEMDTLSINQQGPVCTHVQTERAERPRGKYLKHMTENVLTKVLFTMKHLKS